MVSKSLSLSNAIDDPLTLAIAPAEDETIDQRLLREHGEAEAHRASEEIDELIKQDKVAFKKWQKAVKILLLGQSESGKSTTIKNFQMMYAYDAWVKERISWKTIIHLNLVKSVTIILNVLGRAMDVSKSKPYTRSPFSTSRIHHNPDEGDPFLFDFVEKHKILRLRLQPLFRIRKDLERRLGSVSIDEPDSSSGAISDPYEDHLMPNPCRPAEFFVTTQKGWKAILDRALPCEVTFKKDELNDIIEVIAGCASDIKELWADPVVRAVLKKDKIRLEHESGFFLDDVDRLTARDYEPSDDDIIRARLRTMGIQEYHFNFTNSHLGQEWIMYDVGGARSSRAAWYPYFEGVNSIIFLAPINCFDQRLAEDPKVNRLHDSLQLWKSVCSSKLLADVQMILFLNKVDLLDEKLKSGIKFKNSVLNYRDGENNVKAVGTYLKQHFKSILTQVSPKRVFYCFLTSVIDREAMSSTLLVVSDGIIRNALKSAEFL